MAMERLAEKISAFKEQLKNVGLAWICKVNWVLDAGSRTLLDEFMREYDPVTRYSVVRGRVVHISSSFLARKLCMRYKNDEDLGDRTTWANATAADENGSDIVSVIAKCLYFAWRPVGCKEKISHEIKEAKSEEYCPDWPRMLCQGLLQALSPQTAAGEAAEAVVTHLLSVVIPENAQKKVNSSVIITRETPKRRRMVDLAADYKIAVHRENKAYCVVKAVEVELEEVEEDRDILALDLQKTVAKNIELVAKNTALNSRVAALTAKAEDLAKQNALISSQRGGLEQLKASLTNKVASLEQKFASSASKVAKLESHTSDVSVKLRQYDDKMKQYEEQDVRKLTVELTERVSQQNEALKASQLQLDAWKNKCQQQETRISSLTSMVQSSALQLLQAVNNLEDTA